MNTSIKQIVVLLAACTLSAQADLFYNIDRVTSDTAASDFFVADRLIEGPGVGFDADEPHDRQSTLTWVTNPPNGGAGDYFSPTPNPAPRLVFDLGQNRALHEISVWGYANDNGNGANRFSLQFATDLEGPSGFSTSIGFNPVYTPTQPVAPRQSFDFGQFVYARYVELTPEDNFFGIAPPGGDRVGLGEVAFQIPEPSAGALFLLGATLISLFRTAAIHRRP